MNEEVLLGFLQTAAGLRQRGLSDAHVQERLGEVGLEPDMITGLIEALPKFIEKTGGRVAGPSKIFLSHSHSDRDTAAYLQGILDQNNARTFFDQHEVIPGQDLKDRLSLGLLWCDKLLLVWSAAAARSEFVDWEWKRADRLIKPIIPYVLDGTPLPAKLKRLVFIDCSDQTHGHADLLRTVLGHDWKPEPTTPFPGQWLAELSIMGLGEAEYNLELRANGQIVGSGRIKQSGLVGGIAQSLGISGVLDISIPLTGTWSYNDRDKMLVLDITGTMMGQTNQETVRIHTTGKEQGWLQGQTLGGLPWRLRRAR